MIVEKMLKDLSIETETSCVYPNESNHTFVCFCYSFIIVYPLSFNHLLICIFISCSLVMLAIAD